DKFATFIDKSRLSIITKNDGKKKVPPGFENIVRRNVNVLDNRRLSWYIEFFFLNFTYSIMNGNWEIKNDLTYFIIRDTTKDKIVNGPSNFLDENRRVVRKEIKQKNHAYYDLFNNNNLLRVEEM